MNKRSTNLFYITIVALCTILFSYIGIRYEEPPKESRKKNPTHFVIEKEIDSIKAKSY